MGPIRALVHGLVALAALAAPALGAGPLTGQADQQPARTASTPGAPTVYSFDPAHTFVTFEVLHFDTATIRGRFGPLQGQAEFGPEGTGRVQVVVDVAGVSTGLAVLDALLKGPDLLDAQSHPQAFFIAQDLQSDAQGRLHTVQGVLTLRGVDRPLTLRAERYRCYFNPIFRREVCGGDFVGEIRRSDFGILHSLGFVSDPVRLRIQVEGIRRP